jgi:transposase
LLLDLENVICLMQIMRRCRDPEAKRIALALLARGNGSPGEIAELAGVSRQVVEGWARRLDWRKVKRAALTKAWRSEMRRNSI